MTRTCEPLCCRREGDRKPVRLNLRGRHSTEHQHLLHDRLGVLRARLREAAATQKQSEEFLRVWSALHCERLAERQGPTPKLSGANRESDARSREPRARLVHVHSQLRCDCAQKYGPENRGGSRRDQEPEDLSP